VICAPNTGANISRAAEESEAGVASLRAAEAADADAIQAVLESSTAHDDPAGWTRFAWSVDAWATRTRVLVLEERVVGVVAVRADPAPDGAMPARLALDASARHAPLAVALVQGGVDLVREVGGERARLYVPSKARWIQSAAQHVGFSRVRTIASMLLPATAPSPPLLDPAEVGFGMRSIRPAEDERVLAALNRASASAMNGAATCGSAATRSPNSRQRSGSSSRIRR